MLEQERTRRRTVKAGGSVNIAPLRIPVLSAAEREYVRSHLFYSGASDVDISTTMGVLPLAVDVLLRMRGRQVATIRRAADGWVLTCPPKKERD